MCEFSQVEYQKEHRKNLEQFTAVSETPENARIKKQGELSAVSIEIYYTVQLG